MHTTIRLTVVTVFLLATMLTAGLAIGLQYYFSQSMAKQAAADLYTTASGSIAAELRNIGIINANVIDLLADNPSLSERDAEDTHLETLIRVLEKNPLYYTAMAVFLKLSTWTPVTRRVGHYALFHRIDGW
jgi:hypothetical protein